MKGKIILCRCEDVTLADVRHSIELGYTDIEEVKRYTGFGTGPCQGKECLALIACVLADETRAAPEAIRPFTSRPPLMPTPLKILARLGDTQRLSDTERLGDSADDDAPEAGSD